MIAYAAASLLQAKNPVEKESGTCTSSCQEYTWSLLIWLFLLLLSIINYLDNFQARELRHIATRENKKLSIV